MPANENLGEVLVWLDSIQIGGSSYLLEAFKVALSSEAEGIYLVTDRQVHHTHEFLLNQLPRLRKQFEHWRVCSISRDGPNMPYT